METVKEKENKVFDILKSKLNLTNKMSSPKITKVLVNVGTGSKVKVDKKRNDFIAERLMKITGQKPSVRAAKKSIATFKLREGDVIGLLVTLRGKRMYAFLDKLINITIPRTRDFRGFSKKSIDAMGNLTLGLKEHSIFPETADEDIKDVFGMSITIVTTAKTKEEAEALFDGIGIPFKKEDK